MSSKLRDRPPSWQAVLDCLTRKAKEWNLFDGLERTEEVPFVEQCLRNESLRAYLSDWMGQCLKDSKTKSLILSSKFRRRGNEEFKLCHDAASLSLYTDCIRFAPHASEEHALGLANRSAVLFHLEKYKESVKDAVRALSLPYPDKLRFKLMMRQARCFLKLQDWENCQKILESAESFLMQTTSNEDLHKDEVHLQEVKLQLNAKKESENFALKAPKENVQNLPQLFNGSNPKFRSASAALELRHSEQKGRYVVTTQTVKAGDVLFVEKPYAFVVLPEQYRMHCYHCSGVLLAPIPCQKCADILFCDEECESTCRESYHHWECGGIPLMSAIGIAHLGLRILLTTGSPKQVLERAQAAHQTSSRFTLEYPHDPYAMVFSLLPHFADMPDDDVFQYSATAQVLTLFLVQKTDYFKNEQLQSGPYNNDVVTKVCALLFRHITQLVCNAHAITKLDSDERGVIHPFDGSSLVVSESQQRIATAIYPSASMMNHSCDPNISNSFSSQYLIVKASRTIRKGEEVFNCYGPHFQRMGTAERRAILQGQYFFHCVCSACVTEADPGEALDLIQERLYALRCSSCSGPLVNEAPGRDPAGSKGAPSDCTNLHFMICDSCGSQQPISSLVSDAFFALSLFKQGCEEMESGHMHDALNNLNQCRALQERALYRCNKDLTATYDVLAKCYATLGDYGKSVQVLELLLPSVEEQYGDKSVEVAHELQKLSDVMVWELRTMETTPSKYKLDHAIKVVQRALSIFSTHLGDWNKGWQDLEKKLEELKLMDDMAKMEGNMRTNVCL